MTSPTSPLLQSDQPLDRDEARHVFESLLRPSRLAIPFAGMVALIFAVGIVVVIDKVAPSLPLAIVAGLGLVGLVGLAVGRYEAAVALGFLMSGVVKFEPAPPDGIFAVIIAVAVVTGRLRVDRVPAPVAALLAGLVSINILSFAAADSIGEGVRFVAITFYVIAFAVWLAGYADRESRGRQIVIAWLAIGIFSAILGTAALQLPNFPMRLEFITDGNARSSALFKDPNVFGPFLIPIMVILLEEIIAPRLLRIRAITGMSLLVVLVIGLVFSFSRAAWANGLLSMAIMLLILLLRRRHTARILGMLGGLSIVGMVVLAFVVFSGQASFIGQRAQLQSYDTERFGAQRAGVEIASHYPVGVGPGNFQFHYPIETHSTYVRVLAEQGPFGLVLWISLCLVTLGLAIANAFAGRNAAGIGSAALLGCWCGLLFNSFVVDTLHWRHLWVVAGLIWAAALVGRRDGGDAARGAGAGAAGGGAGAARGAGAADGGAGAGAPGGAGAGELVGAALDSGDAASTGSARAATDAADGDPFAPFDPSRARRLGPGR
jgi:hypothetical protein